MAVVDTKDLLSVAEVGKLGISSVVKRAEEGSEIVVLRNNRPVAAIIGIGRLDEMQRIEADLMDLTLMAARLISTDEERGSSLDQVLARLGVTRERLDALEG